MGAVGTAFELGMVLHAYIKLFARHLHSLHQPAVRRGARQHEACFAQRGAVLIVELIAVAVPLADLLCTVSLRHSRARHDNTGVTPQAHGAAFFVQSLLVGHKVDD